MDNNIYNECNGDNPDSKPLPQDIGSAIDSVLKHVGQMGLYQRLLFVAMLPFGVVWAFSYFGQMFITATPDHWCLVPELQGLNVDLRRNLSIPGAASGGHYERCLVYDADWSQVLDTLTPPPAGTPTVACQHGWEFEFDYIPYPTVVSERKWVCDRAILVSWAQAINFLGSIFGGVFIGRFADQSGRVPAFIGANLIGCIGGIATIFTNGFWDFSFCRFLVGMSVDSCFLMIYILVMEYVGIKHRTWVANMSIALYFGGGCMLLPFYALWIDDWRNLSLAMSLPVLIVMAAPFVVPESARWLISQGKYDKAVRMFSRFERINSTKIPKNVLDEFVATAKATKEKDDGLIVLLRNPAIRSMLGVLVVTFMCCAASFDILVRLSETLGNDFFITFAVSAATEIPSIALLVVLMDRFGRRRLVFYPIMLTGLLSLAAAFTPRGILTVFLAAGARFFNNMAHCAIIQWTPELLPTSLRASGSSFVHVSAFTALLVVPFVVFSGRAWEPLPLVLVALIVIAGGGLALLLPETMGRPMPQTLEDGERLARTRRICGCSKDVEDSHNKVIDGPENGDVA